MQIVKISGGLGNQLFQYAYYLKLKKVGHECYIDDISCQQDAQFRNIQLREVGADYDKAKMDDILELTDHKRDPINWLRRRFTGSNDVIRHEGDEVTKDGYWIGYWQSAKGYDEIEEDLRANIFGPGFKDEITDSDLAKEIKETADSVSIHIRRGDYLNPDVAAVYGGICTDEYYEAAVKYMQEAHPGCKFYVFSNDTEWVKANLHIANMVVVEGSDEEHGYRDMYLMSLCKHNILANSSFSWWGTWLGDAQNVRLVTAPDRWFNNRCDNGIYTDEMIRIRG